MRRKENEKRSDSIFKIGSYSFNRVLEEILMWPFT